MAPRDQMARFWDERAREDAFYFIDNRSEYGRPDEDEFWASGPETLDAFLGLLDARLDADEIVVEIGCGIGRLTRPIAERSAKVIAVDVSEEMLSLARRHNQALANVEWLLGDGRSLAGVPDGVAHACLSHVVFQHIPDPAITLGYVREMGRVLSPGGLALFQVSNDPRVHRAGLLKRLTAQMHVLSVERPKRASRRPRGPGGQSDPAWLGSAVELGPLRDAIRAGGMDVERIYGEGAQFCLVRARRA